MAGAVTPPAAEELLNVIMLDDFVARRKALDTWTRRWVATMEVEALSSHEGPKARESRKLDCLDEAWEGLFKDEVGCMGWEVATGKTRLRMHVLLQKPREL